MTTFTAKIYRYDPTTDTAPRYDTVEVPAQPRMRVLDVLEYAVDQCGIGLAFRHFCGVKRCGLCGVSVNGKPVLSCWEAATPSMVIEPLANMPVIRDLTVDRSAVDEATLALHPGLVHAEPYEGFPELLKHREMEPAYRLMNCIECHVCTAACPEMGNGFAGPGSLVQLAKAALHPKDALDRGELAAKAGVDRCTSCNACDEVCPVGIPIVSGAIEPLRGIAANAQPGRSK